jgi:hypothetical protein
LVTLPLVLLYTIGLRLRDQRIHGLRRERERARARG